MIPRHTIVFVASLLISALVAAYGQAPTDPYFLCKQKAGVITNQYGTCIRSAVRFRFVPNPSRWRQPFVLTRRIRLLETHKRSASVHKTFTMAYRISSRSARPGQEMDGETLAEMSPSLTEGFVTRLSLVDSDLHSRTTGVEIGAHTRITRPTFLFFFFFFFLGSSHSRSSIERDSLRYWCTYGFSYVLLD